ncbi:MAG: P-loop containing dynein motor region D4-domain-containing protein, partial [Olpidium bornovanus]
MLQLVRRECKELAPTTDIGLVSSLINILDSLLDDLGGSNQLTDQEMEARIQSRFIFALVWSIGGSVDTTGRQKFDVVLRAAMSKMKTPFIVPLPESGQVYDYVFSGDGGGKWLLWTDAIDREAKIPANAEYSNITIPTKETVRYDYLLDLLLTHDKRMLLVGPTGTGKSKYITNKLLNGMPKEKYIPMMRMIIFVDDLNMPAKETYGAQPPIELLRQWLDHGNWYDKKDTSKLELIDIQFLAAMGPPGGGRNPVSTRFLRHFSQVAINAFDDQTMEHIFSRLLMWHMTTRGFADEFQNAVPALIGATMTVYRWALANLLPTPAKTHYTFNLRDFSRVVQGLVLSDPTNYTDVTFMVRLWVHEVLRVYGDRLVSDEDRKSLFGVISSTVAGKFNSSMEEIFEHMTLRTPGKVQEDDMRRLLFGDMVPQSINQQQAAPSEGGGRPATADKNKAKPYVEIKDVKAIVSTMEAQLVVYNNLYKSKMNLVLFHFAVEHVVKICRILKLPGGHALLVGVGGSGRQSACRLAAHIMQYETFQIELTKNYTKIEFREDVKKILCKAGQENRPIVFLFSDTQIKEESFIEDINSLLNTGDVPNLFQPDEKQSIIEKAAAQANEEGRAGDGSPAALYNYFIDR